MEHFNGVLFLQDESQAQDLGQNVQVEEKVGRMLSVIKQKNVSYIGEKTFALKRYFDTRRFFLTFPQGQ